MKPHKKMENGKSFNSQHTSASYLRLFSFSICILHSAAHLNVTQPEDFNQKKFAEILTHKKFFRNKPGTGKKELQIKSIASE